MCCLICLGAAVLKWAAVVVIPAAAAAAVTGITSGATQAFLGG